MTMTGKWKCERGGWCNRSDCYHERRCKLKVEDDNNSSVYTPMLDSTVYVPSDPTPDTSPDTSSPVDSPAPDTSSGSNSSE